MDSAPSSPCHAHRDPLSECLWILRQARGTASWYREGYGAAGPDRFCCTPPIQAEQRRKLRRSFLLPSHNLSFVAT